VRIAALIKRDRKRAALEARREKNGYLSAAEKSHAKYLAERSREVVGAVQ
jgi:hypothetical protein